jgi:pimeloyl-ACP methyl ester carboxylesterase
MRYDASLDAVLRPQLGDPLDPALFAGIEDARCAELARLAYFSFKPSERPRLEAALAALGLNRVHLLEDRHSDTQVFVALDAAGTAYVAFRGTQPDSWRDIRTDARFLRLPWAGQAWVHRGFRGAYDSRSGNRAASNLRAELRGLIAGLAPQRLVTTGHSLGGALATLFASDHLAAELVTFGSPLVGNAAFAALFEARAVRRYRQCADLVTRIPFEWIGYRPAPGLRYIDRTGAIAAVGPEPAVIQLDIAQAREAYRRDFAKIPGNAPVRDATDHAPINYVTALLGIREG